MLCSLHSCLSTKTHLLMQILSCCSLSKAASESLGLLVLLG
jgi:hypothetical protein